MLLNALFRTMVVLALIQLIQFTPTSNAQLLSGLPRFNLQTGSAESSDLGSYETVTCEGGANSDDPSKSRSCSVQMNPTADGGMAGYFAGVGFYLAIGLLAGLLVILGSIIFLLYSMFKCCCCRKVLPFDVTKVMDGMKIWSVVAFSICLIMMLVCFFTSTFLGNLAITEYTSSDYSAANSLGGLQHILYSFEPSITHTVLASTSSVLAPTISKTNKTMNRAISVPELIHAFQIVDDIIPSMPNPHNVIRILNSTKKITRNSTRHMDFIIANLEDIDELVIGLNEATSYMQNLTMNLTEVNDDMLDSISQLNNTIDATLDFLNDIVGSGGVVKSCVNDMKDSQRAVNGGKMPNTDKFTEASTGATGSTSRLLSTAMDGVPTEINEMNRKLLALDRNMSALPNYTITGKQLIYLNNSIAAALSPSGIISNLTAQLISMDEILSRPVPILYAFVDTMVEFEGIMLNLTDEVGNTVHVVQVMLPLIESLLPQFELLDDEVNKIFNAKDLLPIFDIMIDQIVSINETLFQLTKPFTDAMDTIRDVNDTFAEFLYNGTLTDILAQMDNANATVSDAMGDASDELVNLNDFYDVLVDSVTDYNISDINSTIYSAILMLESIDLNDTMRKVELFKNSLESVKIEEDFVNKLFALQSKLELTLEKLDSAVGIPNGDYIRLAGGYCTARQDLYCVNDGDCVAGGGTTCNTGSRGVFRCSSPIGATTCSDDSDCTAVDASAHCLVDTTRATALHGALVALADDSTDLDVSDMLADLEDIVSSSDVNLTDMTTILEDSAESVSLFDTNDMVDLLNDIRDGMDSFDTSSIHDNLVSTRDSINEVDFDGFMESISGNLETYDRVANNSFVPNWIEFLETMKDFMFKEAYLKTYLNNVKADVLNDVVASVGPSGSFSYIASQIDHTYNDFRLNQSAVHMKTLNDPFSSRYHDHYELLDKMGGSRYPTTKYAENNQHGSLYYFFSLFKNNTIGNKRTVGYDHPLARGIVTNAEGFRYVDEFGDGTDDVTVYCFSKECFEYTINIVNTAPLSEINAELYPPSYDEGDAGDGDDDGGGGMDIPLDLSREGLMTLLWVPVLILLFIGVCSLTCAAVPRFQKAHFKCNCCFLTCALIILPFIFIFTSFFMFLAIVGEDSCTTGTAIGETYIVLYGDDYCPDTLKGTGTLAECKFNWTLSESFGDNANITITLNVVDTYNALFQKECGMAVDPFEKIALDVAEQIRPLPLNKVVNGLKGSDYALRPALEDIVNSSAVNLGQVIYDLLAETHADGSKVLTCESMSLIYANIEDTACEGVVLPGAWLIGSWYLVGWVICCCGVPASCATLVKTKLVKQDDLIGGGAADGDGEGGEDNDAPGGAGGVHGGGGGGRDREDNREDDDDENRDNENANEDENEDEDDNKKEDRRPAGGGQRGRDEEMVLMGASDDDHSGIAMRDISQSDSGGGGRGGGGGGSAHGADTMI